jgi:hypothetical protein
MDQYIHAATRHVPWNKGQITEQTREALLAWIRTPIVAQTIACFRVACTDRPICLRDSTRESLVAGVERSVSTQAHRA